MGEGEVCAGVPEGQLAGSRLFAHLDAPLAYLYRQILAVFVANKERFVVHLRPEDVAEQLQRSAMAPPSTADGSGPPADAADRQPATTREAVEAALRSLDEWGNLRSSPDTSRVTTVQDFYRSRLLYQLSREGEAAERALAVFEAELGRRGELQSVALADIGTRVRALLTIALDDAAPDPAVVHNLLLELVSRLDSLAANASAFMSGLQRTIDLHDVDEEAFLVYKDRLITYLQRFVGELAGQAYDIAGALQQFPADALERLLLIAAEREASDAIPLDLLVADPGTAAGVRNTEDAEPGLAGAREARGEEWRRRWSGIGSWFVGDRTHPSQAELLLRRARRAIPDLLETVSLLQERRAGRSDRSADFRELARWFAQAPTEDDAHRLWRAAFGMSTARHLTGVVPGRDVPAQTPWAKAPPVEVAPRLRATGRYAKRGAPTRVSDRSTARSHLAALLAREQEEVHGARQRLMTGVPCMLSQLSCLDAAQFRLFLALLGEALSAGPPGADGSIRTTTTDGSALIVLTPVSGAPAARIQTLDGVLVGPEHEITIVDLRPADPGQAQP